MKTWHDHNTKSSPIITTNLAYTYTVRHSVVPVYPSLLTVTLHASIRTTFVYNKKNIQSVFYVIVTGFYCNAGSQTLFRFEKMT